MALNSVSVVGPRSEPQKQEKPKKDWVDNLVTGLQLVKGVTGIAVDYETIQKHMEDRDAQKFAQTGGLTGPQLASAQASGLQEVATGTPGATTYRKQTPDNQIIETGLIKATKEPAPLGGTYKTVADANGKPVERWLPNGGPDQPAYVRPDKPKEANPANAGKTYTELVRAVETPRGNQAVQQASKALVNIGNAEELIAPYADNLDKMPQKQASLLTAELAKIASGGVGSQHGQESLEAKTYNSRFQDFLSQVGNEPEPAQLGAFIQQNRDYLAGLRKSNEAVVNGYKLRIYNGFKNRLTPEENQQFQQEYADLFGGGGKIAPAGAPVETSPKVPKDISGMALGAEGGKIKSHPQDSEALKWANKNRLSPDPKTASKALEILQLNSGK